MSQILGVKFNDYGQVYYFSSGPFVVREGQKVIVKTDQGMGLGSVVTIRQGQQDEGEDGEGGDGEHKAIYRLANEKDLEAQAENEQLAREAREFCRKCIIAHKLEMKLVEVEVFFDRSKMIFYFTAPGRIDFRELIKDLVKEYRTRIELRQIGVRHETQMLGAIGNCGQMCCCRRFMRKFVPVTIKMAKEQNLFLNPTKISGICGRLLCCLSFEQEGYEAFHKQCPKIGKRFNTSFGPVKVIRSNFFKKNITILQENGDEQEIPIDEWPEILNKQPLAAGSSGANGENAKSAPPKRSDRGRPEKGRGDKRQPRQRPEKPQQEKTRQENGREDKERSNQPEAGKNAAEASGPITFGDILRDESPRTDSGDVPEPGSRPAPKPASKNAPRNASKDGIEESGEGGGKTKSGSRGSRQRPRRRNRKSKGPKPEDSGK